MMKGETFILPEHEDFFWYICASLPFGLKFDVDGTVKTLTDIYSVHGLGFDGGGAFYGWDSFVMKPYLVPVAEDNIESVAGSLCSLRESGAYGVSGLKSLLRAQTSSLLRSISDHIDLYGFVERGLALPAGNSLYSDNSLQAGGSDKKL